VTDRARETLMGAVALLATAHLVHLAREAWSGGGLAEIDRPGPSPPRFLVDVNRADMDELGLLPRIGPELASRIIAARSEDRPFTAPDDLLDVRGIGPKKVEAMRGMLDFR